MPAKAGKFVLRASDMTVPGGNGGFSVDDVGFEPDITIVMSVGLSTEDAWNTTPPTWGNMALLSRSPSLGATGDRTGLNEFWGTDIKPSSGWSDTGVMWFKSSHGGGGPAIYAAGTHEDGFYIGYPGGFEGGYGIVCYYLAMKSVEENVARIYGYQGATMPIDLGWEPNIFFSLAHGGLGSGAGPIFLADWSVPSWGFGALEDHISEIGNIEWMANGLSHATSVEQVRYIIDGAGDQIVFDPATIGQDVENGGFAFGGAGTNFSANFFQGFPQAEFLRTGTHLVEGGLYTGQAITPNPVGVPLLVDPGFTPEAVIFLGPQDSFPDAVFGGVPWGGRCFGFLTADFQCCMAWGAYSHIGTVANFCTSNFSWISNFTSTALSDPTNPNYGTAEIGDGGFTLHTQALPKFNKYLRYAAYGFEEEAPGFFRVI